MTNALSSFHRWERRFSRFPYAPTHHHHHHPSLVRGFPRDFSERMFPRSPRKRRTMGETHEDHGKRNEDPSRNNAEAGRRADVGQKERAKTMHERETRDEKSIGVSLA